MASESPCWASESPCRASECACWASECPYYVTDNITVNNKHVSLIEVWNTQRVLKQVQNAEPDETVNEAF